MKTEVVIQESVSPTKNESANEHLLRKQVGEIVRNDNCEGPPGITDHSNKAHQLKQVHEESKTSEDSNCPTANGEKFPGSAAPADIANRSASKESKGAEWGKQAETENISVVGNSWIVKGKASETEKTDGNSDVAFDKQGRDFIETTICDEGTIVHEPGVALETIKNTYDEKRISDEESEDAKTADEIVGKTEEVQERSTVTEKDGNTEKQTIEDEYEKASTGYVEEEITESAIWMTDTPPVQAKEEIVKSSEEVGTKENSDQVREELQTSSVHKGPEEHVLEMPKDKTIVNETEAVNTTKVIEENISKGTETDKSNVQSSLLCFKEEDRAKSTKETEDDRVKVDESFDEKWEGSREVVNDARENVGSVPQDDILNRSKDPMDLTGSKSPLEEETQLGKRGEETEGTSKHALRKAAESHLDTPSEIRIEKKLKHETESVSGSETAKESHGKSNENIGDENRNQMQNKEDERTEEDTETKLDEEQEKEKEETETIKTAILSVEASKEVKADDLGYIREQIIEKDASNDEKNDKVKFSDQVTVQTKESGECIETHSLEIKDLTQGRQESLAENSKENIQYEKDLEKPESLLDAPTEESQENLKQKGQEAQDSCDRSHAATAIEFAAETSEGEAQINDKYRKMPEEVESETNQLAKEEGLKFESPSKVAAKVIAEDRDSDDKEKPVNRRIKVEEGGGTETAPEEKPVAFKGIELEETTHNQNLHAVESAEQIQSPTLELPYEGLEKITTSIDEKIKEKPETETLNQAGQEQTPTLKMKGEMFSLLEQNRKLEDAFQAETSMADPSLPQEELSSWREQVDETPIEEKQTKEPESPNEVNSNERIRISSALPSKEQEQGTPAEVKKTEDEKSKEVKVEDKSCSSPETTETPKPDRTPSSELVSRVQEEEFLEEVKQNQKMGKNEVEELNLEEIHTGNKQAPALASEGEEQVHASDAMKEEQDKDSNSIETEEIICPQEDQPRDLGFSESDTASNDQTLSLKQLQILSSEESKKKTATIFKTIEDESEKSKDEISLIEVNEEIGLQQEHSRKTELVQAENTAAGLTIPAEKLSLPTEHVEEVKLQEEQRTEIIVRTEEEQTREIGDHKGDTAAYQPLSEESPCEKIQLPSSTLPSKELLQAIPTEKQEGKTEESELCNETIEECRPQKMREVVADQNLPEGKPDEQSQTQSTESSLKGQDQETQVEVMKAREDGEREGEVNEAKAQQDANSLTVEKTCQPEEQPSDVETSKKVENISDQSIKAQRHAEWPQTINSTLPSRGMEQKTDNPELVEGDSSVDIKEAMNNEACRSEDKKPENTDRARENKEERKAALENIENKSSLEASDASSTKPIIQTNETSPKDSLLEVQEQVIGPAVALENVPEIRDLGMTEGNEMLQKEIAGEEMNKNEEAPDASNQTLLYEATKEVYEENKLTDVATSVLKEIPKEEVSGNEKIPEEKRIEESTFALESLPGKEEKNPAQKATVEERLNHKKNTDSAAKETNPEVLKIQSMSAEGIKKNRDIKKEEQETVKSQKEGCQSQQSEIAQQVQQFEKTIPVTSYKQIPAEETQSQKNITKELQKNEVETKRAIEEEHTSKKSARSSLSDLIQQVNKDTSPTKQHEKDDKEMKISKEEEKDGEEHKDKETEKTLIKEATTEEEKNEEDHKDEKEDKTSPDSIVTLEARDTIIKTPNKKSHNILSGVGSKVKYSISKVKKAITGKSSHAKTV